MSSRCWRIFWVCYRWSLVVLPVIGIGACSLVGSPAGKELLESWGRV